MASFRRAYLALPALLGTFAFAGCSSDTGSPDRFGSTSAAIATFPNDKAAFDFFIGKGLTGEQAAGIIGNLDVESGDDPSVSQEGGGPGRGLAQWLAGGRWDTTSGDNENDYAASQGLSDDSLKAQLGFIWYELNKFPSYGLARLKEATTVSSAVSAFEADFEGCSACDSSKRVSDGENVLEAYGSDTVGTADAGTGPGDDDDDDDAGPTACIVPATGESGECMATSACDALGDHTSTPGYCPGADDIQCCTATSASGTGGTTTTLPDGGTVTTVGTGTGSSSGTTTRDGGSPTEDAASADSGGCSMSTSTNGHLTDSSWLVGLALLGLSRSRRRSRTSI